MRPARVASAALALVIALTAAACTTAEAPGPAPAASGTAAGSAYGATLDAQQFAASLETPGTIVLDVRTPAEYAEGHLPDAVLADVSGDFNAAVADLDRSAPYAVYCRSGNRSAAALQRMKQLGFTNAWHLAGGIGAWQAAGHDVVTGPPPPRA